MNGHCDKTSQSWVIRSILCLNTLKPIWVKITFSISDANSRFLYEVRFIYRSIIQEDIFLAHVLMELLRCEKWVRYDPPKNQDLKIKISPTNFKP